MEIELSKVKESHIKCPNCEEKVMAARTTALHDTHGSNTLYEYSCGSQKHVKYLAEGASIGHPVIDLHLKCGEN